MTDVPEMVKQLAQAICAASGYEDPDAQTDVYWRNRAGEITVKPGDPHWHLFVKQARAAIEAHEAALAAAGLVIVPREPTEAMCEAEETKRWVRHCANHENGGWAYAIYRAMIAAAPKRP